MNVKEVAKVLKYELKKCEVDAMDKFAKDLEDAARQHNSKILKYREVIRVSVVIIEAVVWSL
jgi:hypothetical protein